MRQWLVIGILVVFAVPGMAQSVNPDQMAIDQDQFQGVVDEVLGMLPGAVGSLVGDQRVNVHILADGNASIQTNQTIGIEIEGLNVTSWQDEPVANATLEVWVNGSTVEELIVSDDRRSVLEDAVRSGDVRYEAHGLLNRILVRLVRIGVKVLVMTGLL